MTPTSALPRFATPTEAAKILGRDVQSIWRGLRKGTIPGVKLAGRWYVDLTAIANMFPSSRAS